MTNKHIIMFCIAIYLSSPLSTFSKPGSADSTHLSINCYGPFVLLSNLGDTIRLHVQVHHIHFSSELKYDWPETDCSFEFIDFHSKTLYRINNKPARGQAQITIKPVQIYIPHVGPLLLLMQEGVPSAPPSLTGQLFGINDFGEVVPFSTTIEPDEIGISELAFRPVLVEANGIMTESNYSSDTSAVPAIEVDQWTGNFTVHKLYSVWSTPHAPEFLNQMKFKIEIDTIEAARIRKRHYEPDIMITLYSKPNKWKTTTISLRLLPSSSIKFLDAVHSDEWWLHVIIDGTEGYVIDPDFPKLGLLDAG
jgi:hypothetical protein